MHHFCCISARGLPKKKKKNNLVVILQKFKITCSFNLGSPEKCFHKLERLKINDLVEYQYMIIYDIHEHSDLGLHYLLRFFF